MKGLVKMFISTGIMAIGLAICGIAFYDIPPSNSLFEPVYYSGVLIAIGSILPLLLGSIDSFFEKVDEVVEHNRRFDEEQKKPDTSGFPGDVI